MQQEITPQQPIKPKKKWLKVILIIVIVILLGIGFYKGYKLLSFQIKYRGVPKTVKECIKEFENWRYYPKYKKVNIFTLHKKLISGRDYQAETTIVRFKKGITENEVRNIVNSLNLSIDEKFLDFDKKKSQITVPLLVPPGTEFKWTCLLREHPKIDSTILNDIVR